MHLAAAVGLALGAESAVAERAVPLFEKQDIHDSYPTGLSLVDLDGQHLLVTVAWDGWLKLWNAESGAAAGKVQISTRRLHRLVVTKFGVALIGGDDGLFVYDLHARRVFTHLLSGVALHHAVIHPSLPVAFAADSSGKIYAFNLASNEVENSWPTLGRSLIFFGITQDGETLITADTRTVKLWSAATGAFLKSYEPLGPNEPIAAVVLRSTSDVLYVGYGNQVAAIDITSDQIKATLTVSSLPIVGLAQGVTPGELLVASRGGEVNLWDFDLGCSTVALASDGDEGFSYWTFSADHRRAFALMPIISMLKGWNLENAGDGCR